VFILPAYFATMLAHHHYLLQRLASRPHGKSSRYRTASVGIDRGRV
jgi:hypothetical protein